VNVRRTMAIAPRRWLVEAHLRHIVEIYTPLCQGACTAELETNHVEARLPWFGEHSPEQYPFWVAELEGRVNWLARFQKIPAALRVSYHAEISVYVDEEFRRGGVGRRLLEHAIARAPSLGITALVGLIFGHNEPSLKLFQRFGFERWAFLPGVAQLDGVDRDLV